MDDQWRQNAQEWLDNDAWPSNVQADWLHQALEALSAAEQRVKELGAELDRQKDGYDQLEAENEKLGEQMAKDATAWLKEQQKWMAENEKLREALQALLSLGDHTGAEEGDRLRAQAHAALGERDAE